MSLSWGVPADSELRMTGHMFNEAMRSAYGNGKQDEILRLMRVGAVEDLPDGGAVVRFRLAADVYAVLLALLKEDDA